MNDKQIETINTILAAFGINIKFTDRPTFLWYVDYEEVVFEDSRFEIKRAEALGDQILEELKKLPDIENKYIKDFEYALKLLMKSSLGELSKNVKTMTVSTFQITSFLDFMNEHKNKHIVILPDNDLLKSGTNRIRCCLIDKK